MNNIQRLEIINLNCALERNVSKKMNKEKSNKKFMLLSFFGILFVVSGHCFDGLNLMSDYFPYYSFHMPLFLFISGYFYNPQNENTWYDVWKFICKKIKKIIIPFFIWNLFYGVIVTLLRNGNVIQFGNDINIMNLLVWPWVRMPQYGLNLPAWFLLTLFIVIVVYLLFRKLLNKHINEYILTLFFIALGFISVGLVRKEYNPYLMQVFRVMFAMQFYHIGYMYKIKFEKYDKVNSVVWLVSLTLINVVLIKIFNNIVYNMQNMQFSNIFVPFITSMTGILFWTRISEIFQDALGKSKIINYISSNTFSIMMHHMFWIFLFNFIISIFSTKFNLTGFDMQKFRSTVYYCYTPGCYQLRIVYIMLGIFAPISAKFFYDKFLYERINKIKNIIKEKVNMTMQKS